MKQPGHVPSIRRHPHGFTRRRAVAGWAFCLLCLTLAACRREASDAAAKPDLLVVTFDTTRADRFSCYGYAGDRTPTVDRLAAEGVRYARCHAPAPITLPSHSTLFTGLYPFRHGIRDNGVAALDPRVETLAETLGKQGYSTGAVIGAYVLHARYGLAQGFEYYDDDIDEQSKENTFHFAERNAEAVSASAVQWLGKAGDAPYFLWTHYFDPHIPYAPPGAPEGLTQRALYDLEIIYADAQLERVVRRAREVSRARGRELILVFTADHGESLGEHGEPTHAVFVYEETVHVPLIVVDPRRGKPGTVVNASVSLVDVFPDLLNRIGIALPYEVHGRKLPLNDGEAGPRRAVYFETYMPLNTYGWSPLEGVLVDFDKFIKSPNPERYDLANDPEESRNLHRAGDEPSARLAEALASLKSLPLKAPVFEATGVSSDGKATRALRQLGYFSAAVAAEGDHSKLPDPKTVLPLHILMNEVMGKSGTGRPEDTFKRLAGVIQVDPNNRSALQFLCELAASPDEWEPALNILQQRLSAPLPEPFDETVPVAVAGGMTRKGEAAAAIEMLRPFVQRKPESTALLSALGVALLDVNQAPQAREVLLKVVQLDPEHRPALTALGDIAFESGQFGEAASRFRAAIDVGPEPLDALMLGDGDHHRPVVASATPRRERLESELHVKLARSMLGMGRRDGVQPVLERAVTLDPSFPTAQMELGAYLLESDRAAESLPHYQEACRLNPQDADCFYNLGGALLRLGRLPEAESAYREALRMNPNLGRGWINLGIVLMQQGRRDDGKEAFTRASRIEDTRAEGHYSLGITLVREGDSTGARREFEAALGASPGHPAAMIALARLHLAEGRAPDAVDVLRRGSTAAPQFHRAVALLAQVLSTSRDADVRNGREALELATKASAATQHRDPFALHALACAFAETGDLDKAQRTATDALGKAQASGQAELAAEINASLTEFRAGRPARDPRY